MVAAGLSDTENECFNVKNKRQEAQLSQTDRAMLRVTECLAKLLKVTQGHSK